ncbi:MAG: class I SAM-dependent methyltransferase [Bacteroidetes bacterium]|nr:MAG: class I SAM-dependent methyltransferase [Bacteroidota bacterium]MBL1144034.1 class I SAM-dependent methyltransferase [Bacteroidota bacterium]NOG56834.1 class I SAM-dependent methyltransferase [Bacteroidota bacterium]
MIKKLILKLYPILDKIFLKVDKSQIRRTKNIRLIPGANHRKGGKVSYAEWAHVIGVFQTVIYQTIEQKAGNNILDIGCGTGLLGIASEPFTYQNGSYTGIDVMKHDIKFCLKNYNASNYKFIHFDVANPTYAANQDKEFKAWPIENESKDLVTALSVWTHLCEEDAKFYFNEIARVLKKNGKAIITFFYLDERYEDSLAIRKDEKGRFHSTNQMKWIYDTKAYKSKDWFTTSWSNNPEEAIAINKNGIEILTRESGLNLIKYYPGNWKEQAGTYFQDILVFEKK